MSDIKVEIGNVKIVDKGALKAFFSLLIHPEGQQIFDCKYFCKGEARWWAMPQKEIKRPEKSEFLPIIRYLNKQYESELKSAVLNELTKKIRNDEDPAKQEDNLQSEAQELWF